MKTRINGLKAVVATDKMGFVEGVLVTPVVAKKLLNDVSAFSLVTYRLKDLCREVNA